MLEKVTPEGRRNVGHSNDRQSTHIHAGYTFVLVLERKKLQEIEKDWPRILK